MEWLNQQQIEKLCLTGGNAGVIAENINIPAQIFVEFDAASQGLGILLKEQGHDLADYIFAMFLTVRHYIISTANHNVGRRYRYRWRHDSRTRSFTKSNH